MVRSPRIVDQSGVRGPLQEIGALVLSGIERQELRPGLLGVRVFRPGEGQLGDAVLKHPSGRAVPRNLRYRAQVGLLRVKAPGLLRHALA